MRRAFLENLSILDLGYEGLFTNIFSVISATDMGAGTLLIYRLYQAVATNDEPLTRRYVSMAARLYLFSAAAMLLIGVAIMPLLPRIILDKNLNWQYVYTVYVLQLFGTACTAFLSYHRLILLANQRASDIAFTEMSIRVGALALKIAIILITKSYISYVAATVAANLICYLLIRRRARRTYPQLYGASCSMADFREKSFMSELKGVWLIRLLSVTYFLTDTVLMSAMLGLNYVGIYSNYTMIGGSVAGGIQTMLKPIGDSVANYMYTNDRAESHRLYRTMHLLVFLIASMALCGFVVMFQPAITFLFGEQYQLSFPFVVVYSLTLYVGIMNYSIIFFRSAIGEYKSELGWIALSAAANVVLSIAGAMRFGITGILMGTLISQMISRTGYYYITYRYHFRMRAGRDMANSFLLTLMAGAEAGLLYWLTLSMPMTVSGLIARAALCIAGPMLLNCAALYRTTAFADLRRYIMNALRIIWDRIRKR